MSTIRALLISGLISVLVFLGLSTHAYAQTTYFSDDFNVGSSVTLGSHTPDVGTGWTQLINNGKTLHVYTYNNHVTTVSNGTNVGTLYQAEGTYSSADYEIVGTISFAGGDWSYSRSLAARIQDANNMYLLRQTWGSTGFQIYKRTAGTWTLLGSAEVYVSGNTTSPYKGDTFGLRVEGNQISALHNGSVVLTVTDSDHSAAGKAGIGTGYINVSTDDSGTGVGIDDIVVRTLGDSTAPTVSTLSPTDNATGVSTTANLVITFTESVDAEAGASNDITLKKTSDNSTIETIDAQDAKVTGSGSATITINPDATLADSTEYYVQVGADAFDDAAGNSFAGISNTTTWSFTTGDFTNPATSSVAVSPSSTSATVTWTTDELSSSRVLYGLTSSQGLQTAETDTSPRVTSHTVNLSSLKSCRRYYFQVKSTDASSNVTTSNQSTFTTTGCPVTSVSNGTEATITTAAGGEFSLTNNTSTAKLTVPDGFAAEDADFQINRLSTSGIPDAPSGMALIDDNIFDLSALTASDTDLTSFIKTITFVVTYGADAVSAYDESTLDVYRYNTGTSTWEKQNCTLDTVANTLTCSLTSFSTYGVYGTQSVASSGSSSTSSSETGTSTVSAPCSDLAPVNAPDLFQIDMTDTTATLYFAPASDTDWYYISFSTQKIAEEHGGLVKLDRNGVQSFTVELLSPNTPYFFKVRGQKGCMPGPWSAIKEMTTTHSSRPAKATRQEVLGTSKYDERVSGLSTADLKKDNVDEVPVKDSHKSDPAPSVPPAWFEKLMKRLFE